ncbi:hypothetical protein PFISCL1PPCAC_8878, partial [Pristionchus fissidentatus]
LSNIDNMGATVDLNILNFVLHSPVKDFLGRFQGIPDLLELDHLTVSGDVTFGKDVSLKVRYGNHHCEPRRAHRHSARID